MPELKRSGSNATLPSPGPFLAIITNHLDPTYMGALEVALLKKTGSDLQETAETHIVNYLSPFAGNTAIRYEGSDSSNFNDVQKSYGFWAVPPDIGSTVMVIFLDGDPNQGYWFGCVLDRYQNYMTPGIASSQNVEITPDQERKYGTKNLPVGEFHKRSRSADSPNVNQYNKPIHPFADRLLANGLLLDTVRGVTSSSARREIPSMVFGMSTPGPLDPNGKKVALPNTPGVQTPVSRLGGSTFVMDDGDEKGENELVRIRTRTGHQILMHNSQDLIYIANSAGTAWIELTSNGKIDIYAQDSVSIHSEEDFNFRADRDINFEAGRNMNISAGGGIEINCIDRFYLICDSEGKIQIGGSTQWTTGADFKFKAGANANMIAGTDIKYQAGSNISLTAGTDFKSSAGGNISQTAGADWKVTGATTNIKSGHHIETAGTIDMNGPAAAVADPADAADAAVIPDKLEKYSLPNRDKANGWEDGKFYKASNIDSIMMRVPTHEPWDHHENINGEKFLPANTDVRTTAPVDGPSKPTGEGGAPPVNNAPIAKPLSKNAAANEQYLQSVLINGGVTDPIKLAAWMAQCKIESAGFRALREYASGSEYEGRKDLGNTQPGDGVRYKGRGFIQCTGRDNYAKMSKYFGVDVVAKPELVEELELAAKSVLWFFNVYKASRTASVNWDDCTAVTKIVNGGVNALAQRKTAYDAYKADFQANGITPKGTVGTGSGGVLTSGSGAPVKTGQ
jgi:predicted chitinase